MGNKLGSNESCSEQKIAELESKLASMESKWGTILDHAPTIIISLNHKGEISFANQHFLELTGWQFDEIASKSWFDLFLPDDVGEQVREVFQEIMRQKSVEIQSIHQCYSHQRR